MCYHDTIWIAWILFVQLTAIFATNSTILTSNISTSTSPEALPIIWRTSTTTTQLPVLPTYLVPPPIAHQRGNITLAIPTNEHQITTMPSSNSITHKHRNHNYDKEYTTQTSFSSDKTQIQLLQDINNLDINLNTQQSPSIYDDYIKTRQLLNMSSPDKSGNSAQKDRSRLKAYGDSIPVSGRDTSHVSLGNTYGNAGNDSLQPFRYEGTLMAFVNNPFGNGKTVVGKPKKCHDRKKCNAITYNSPHSNNFLHDTVPSTKPSDAGDNLDPLDQPTSEVDSNTEPRFKRGVIHLYNMVSCATGCNPLIYKGYGCYCGFLGSGYAVDGIDRCCKFHDWCYDTAKCPMYLEYFIPYYWKCYHRRPICAIDHGEWGGAGSCAQRLCECDRVLSDCLSRYPCPSTRAICTSSPWRLLQNAFMIL